MKTAARRDCRYDPAAILQLRYTNLVAGHFRKMGSGYRIERQAGTHDWLILLGISGRGVFRRNGQEIPICPGQVVVFKPETPHDYGTDQGLGRWELLWAHFHAPASWLPLLSWPEPVHGVLFLNLPHRTRAGRQILEAFHEMHRLANSSLPRHDWLAMNSLERVLLKCDALANRAGSDSDPRLENILQHIETHLSEPLYLSVLADLAGLSISKLSALFRQHLKASPQVYVEGKRMDLAGRLLQFPSISIKEVAFMSGFTDPLYFSKRFKRHFGLAPSDYRRSCHSGGCKIFHVPK